MLFLCQMGGESDNAHKWKDLGRSGCKQFQDTILSLDWRDWKIVPFYPNFVS
jgi:hypothetical protein